MYLRSIAKHPLLGKDTQFRQFLELQDMVEGFKLPYRAKVAEQFLKMADRFSM